MQTLKEGTKKIYVGPQVFALLEQLAEDNNSTVDKEAERLLRPAADGLPVPEDGITELVITLPNKVIDKLDNCRAYKGKRLAEFAAETIEYALGKQVPPKESFFGRRHWDIPKDTFILTALPKEEWQKLWTWNDCHDQVAFYSDANGEVVIINETRLGKWNRRKTRKTKAKA